MNPKSPKLHTIHIMIIII